MFIRTPWWHGSDGAGLSYPGSHGSQNADVRLWVTFEGGSASDLSSYANTKTETDATYTSSGLRIYASGYPATPNPQQILYDGTAASNWNNDNGWTAEGFVTVTHTENNTIPAILFQYWEKLPTSTNIERFELTSNTGDCEYNNAGFGVEAGPSPGWAFTWGVKKHWAWCVDAGSGVQRAHFYVDGVEVFFFDLGHTPDSSNTGGFALGGICNTNSFVLSKIVDVLIGETRVVKRALYPNGTTFTPPTEGALSVIS